MYPKLISNTKYSNYELAAVNPENPYLPAYHGTFQLEVDVAGKKRRMLAYAPKGHRDSTAGVLILGENGKTADELLNESFWKAIADTEPCKEKLIVFFLEPENGIWHTDEAYGKPDGDAAYINAAAAVAAERHLFCIHESKIYLFGCREGGAAAHMAAMYNPAFYAGIATAGSTAVSKEYTNAAAEDYCLNLDGYEDPEHRKDIRKGNIPLPAWIIEDPSFEGSNGKNALKYWRNAAGITEAGHQHSPDMMEYKRTDETPYPLNQEKEAYRICSSSIPNSSDSYANQLLPRIWKDFLYRQRRWMSCPGGDLRVTEDPVRDLHMEYHYEKVDGWNREWYVYIPEQVKLNPTKKVPLVLAMHGYTCSGEIYAGNSGWHRAAEKYGFIAVFPSALHAHVNMPDCGLMPEWAPLAAWNIFEENDRPDELSFFNQLLDRTIETYPVDPDRIFATGHSWGSLMTEMLALGMTDRLAGAAPCSGVFFGGAYDKMTALKSLNRFNDRQLPIWMFWGMEEEWLIPGVPTHENETGKTLDLWMKKNGKEQLIPENWSEFPAEINGRFLDHFIETDGDAPVRYTQVDYMPHATMPEMSFRIWEEFFSGLKRK